MQEEKQTDPKSYWSGSEGTSVTAPADDELLKRQAKARLRHRVIGAVVLVATAVTFLPILFETPAIQTEGEAQTRIPAVPEQPLGKLELSVNKPQPMPSDQGPLRDLSQPNDLSGTDETKALPVPESESASAVADEEGTLFIQVLATSSERGAMREMAKYQAIGIPVYAVKVQKKSATLWRVRLGLFKNKADAEKVVQYLNAQKISHMPIQVEKTDSSAIERIKPAQTLKAATQKAAEQGQKTDASQASSKQDKKVTEKASQVPKNNQNVSKSAPKPQVQKQDSVKKSAPSKASAEKKKPVANDDPLASMIKSAEKDFIAEQLAKERARQP